MNMDLIKSDLQKLGEEVFDRHIEEVFQALGAICRCRNVVQDWGMWKWRDTIWMPTAEEELHGESFQELNRALENTEKWTDEKIPLKNFLISGVRLMAGIHKWEKEKEEWFEWMSNQILVNQYSGIRLEQYSGYQLYLAYLYFLGACMIKNYPSKPDILLDRFRTLIPEEAQEDYDEDFRLLREMWQKEKQKMDETHMEENFSKFSRTKDYFHKLFYHMEEEGICCMMEEIDYLTLEKALSCADKKLRDRFRKNLPEKMRQEISYRLWAKEDYWNYYGCDTEERREAMKRMICMAGGLWSRSLVDDSGAMRLKLVWI